MSERSIVRMSVGRAETESLYTSIRSLYKLYLLYSGYMMQFTSTHGGWGREGGWGRGALSSPTQKEGKPWKIGLAVQAHQISHEQLTMDVNYQQRTKCT